MPYSSTLSRAAVRALIALVSTVILAGAAAACSSDGEPEAAPAACELMTRADVKAVYGVDTEGVEVPEDPPDPTSSRCAYDTGAAGQIRLLVQTLPDVDTAEAQFEDFRRQFVEFEEVEGVGDEAVWAPPTSQLMVRSGTTYFVLTSPVDTSKETAEEMAARVLSALHDTV